LSFLIALLDAQAWPWESAFLAALPAHVRLRLELMRTDAQHASNRPAPARNAYIVEAVAQALGQCHAGRNRTAVPSRIVRVIDRLRTWKR
jgi:hypothetical protein